MIEIYGTLGPACRDQATLKKMFEEGMTGIRLNLSHTSLKQSSEMLEAYASAAKSAGVKADLLIDMQGPELRLGVMEPLVLNDGQNIRIHTEGDLPFPKFVIEQMQTDDHVLLDDGRIELLVTKKDGVTAEASIIRGGRVTSRKSIKIVGRNVYGPVLTEADLSNLRNAHQFGVTAVMQPFVRNGEDLRRVRALMQECGAGDLRIFAKIENMEGVRHIEEIIAEADMIVIARGDLGNDMPLWQLPAVQKQLEDACHRHNCAYMVVTQMLTSMIDSPVPTRAEVSDIFHAAYHGTASVMVTNETAAGHHPVEAIRYLARTAAEGEKMRKQ